ncbi:MAG: histone deacetylase [Verrucomicrobia bacterium]|nr:histone deacetylase [Verrucomicrobiota bacterium]
MVILHDERCAEYVSPGHPERPFRVTSTVEQLKQQSALKIEWQLPKDASTDSIRRAHSLEHVEHLRVAEQDFDADTPCYQNINDHARRAAGAGLDALELARNGRSVFSLMRPPGHHSTKNQAMGFCYLSSMAIAVLEGVEQHGIRVAVLDFDVHHGNGTEDVLLGKKDILFTSIHQSPCYPGTGLEHHPPNCRNYPQKPYTPSVVYRLGIKKALGDISSFKPDILGVSAGFDAYSGDPIAQELLEIEDFQWIGQQIAGLGIPSFSILEGGYSDSLSKLIQAYLYGLCGVSVA